MKTDPTAQMSFRLGPPGQQPPNLRERILARVRQHPTQTMGEHAQAFDITVTQWLSIRGGRYQ